MVTSLKDRVCVVTGAARSIGLAIAERYCQEAAKVVMIDINPQVEKEAERLKEAGHQVTSYVLDITDQARVLEVFEEIYEQLGPVYALVNNAGIVDQRPFEEITSAQMDQQMRVNVSGTLFCSQGAIRGMKENQEGKIINFSSMSGKTGSALMVHYSAAKGAIIALTQALAYELASYKINVNCLCPGITDATGVWGEVSKGYIHNLQMPREEVVKQFTAKIPLKRLTNIDDVVDFAYFLTVSGDYCTGQAFNITGGREMH